MKTLPRTLVFVALASFGCAANRAQVAQKPAGTADPDAQTRADPASDAPADPTQPSPEPSPQKATTPGAASPTPSDRAADASIENAFQQWSAGWMFDRYVPGSVRSSQRGFEHGLYIVQGVFTFVRGGAPLTIPFQAGFKSSSNRIVLARLCYADATSGMTDCVDPNLAVAQEDTRNTGTAAQAAPANAVCDAGTPSQIDGNSAFLAGRAALNKNDFTQAVCFWRAGATQGHARSQALLSYLLVEGKGVTQDQKAAFAFASKSANAGDFFGQIMLARMYHFGQGTAVDEAKAKAWCAKGLANVPGRPAVAPPSAQQQANLFALFMGATLLHMIIQEDDPNSDYNQRLDAYRVACQRGNRDACAAEQGLIFSGP